MTSTHYFWVIVVILILVGAAICAALLVLFTGPEDWVEDAPKGDGEECPYDKEHCHILEDERIACMDCVRYIKSEHHYDSWFARNYVALADTWAVTEDKRLFRDSVDFIRGEYIRYQKQELKKAGGPCHLT